MPNSCSNPLPFFSPFHTIYVCKIYSVLFFNMCNVIHIYKNNFKAICIVSMFCILIWLSLAQNYNSLKSRSYVGKNMYCF